MTKEKFEKLSSADQWKWIVENKEKIALIELDNDVTYVRSSVFNEEFDDEEDGVEVGYVTTKEYLGNGPALEDLLNAIGIESTGV